MLLLTVTCWCFVVIGAGAAELFTDEEFGQLPRLFHLDNYKRCLAKKQGLYCLGTFQLTADGQSTMYDSLKEYSSNPRHFNHTLLHRGYCVSSRCPSTERNTTLRFEGCVRNRTRSFSMDASLQKLKYCRTREQSKATIDTSELSYRIFLAVVCVLLILNAVGTAYHLFVGDNNKSTILTCWSIKANWRRLVSSYDDEDRSTIAPIQGARVLLLILVLLAHAIELTYKIHLANPNYLESVQRNPMSMILRNGSSIVQTFIVISNFLFSYILLGYSQKKNVSLSMMPMCILYRIVRISPVYLLMVGFSATWWRLAGDGPLWPELVVAESDICRRKFWSHVFYVQNLVEPEKQCMLQSWYLAVDMQLYIVACFLTLLLINNRRRALYTIGALFITSCLLNLGLAYIFNWKSLLFLLSPENMRTTFEGVSSFWYFYISPWGSLPACFLGLFVAHLQIYAKEQGYEINKTKWLVKLYNISVPLAVAWVLTGHVMSSQTTRFSTAAYIGIERPMFSAISALALYGVADNIDSWFRRWMSWGGWQVPARLSLCVLVVHRAVNTQLVATRSSAISTSVLAIVLDLLRTTFASYLLAVPMSLMVEMPIQRTFVSLML